MSAGLVVWWATPAKPTDHFSAEELTASDRYHRPLRRAAAIGAGGRLLLLVMACWLLAVTIGGGGPSLGQGSVQGQDSLESLSGAGFFDVISSRSLLVGAVLTAVALRLPAIAVDGWFEYRFRPLSEGTEYDPVPFGRFVATVVMLFLVVVAGLVVAGGAIYRLAAATSQWPSVLGGVVLAVVCFAGLFEHRFRLPGAGPADLDRSDPIGLSLARLAERFGLGGLRFEVTKADPDAALRGAPAINAHAAGVGVNRRVVVTEGLLTEPDRRREFVVAHELAHTSRHHIVAKTMVSLVASILVIQLVGLAAANGRLWEIFHLGPLDPAAMPVAALAILIFSGGFGPVVAWFARYQERVADADAIVALGPLGPDDTRELLGVVTADLTPPWWIRAISHHPTPTERMEFMERCRRSL